MSFNISLCLQTSSALLIRTSRVIHYLQLAGTYHSLKEHLKFMLGTINQYQMYNNFHETDAFSREMASSLQAAACPTCTAWCLPGTMLSLISRLPGDPKQIYQEKTNCLLSAVHLWPYCSAHRAEWSSNVGCPYQRGESLQHSEGEPRKTTSRIRLLEDSMKTTILHREPTGWAWGSTMLWRWL